MHPHDGLIMEYGRHHNSAFGVPGKAYNLKWLVSRFSDTYGSYIDVRYGHAGIPLLQNSNDLY